MATNLPGTSFHIAFSLYSCIFIPTVVITRLFCPLPHKNEEIEPVGPQLPLLPLLPRQGLNTVLTYRPPHKI